MQYCLRLHFLEIVCDTMNLVSGTTQAVCSLYPEACWRDSQQSSTAYHVPRAAHLTLKFNDIVATRYSSSKPTSTSQPWLKNILASLVDSFSIEYWLPEVMSVPLQNSDQGRDLPLGTCQNPPFPILNRLPSVPLMPRLTVTRPLTT